MLHANKFEIVFLCKVPVLFYTSPLSISFKKIITVPRIIFKFRFNVVREVGMLRIATSRGELTKLFGEGKG